MSQSFICLVKGIQEKYLPFLTPFRVYLNRWRYRVKYRSLRERFTAIHDENYWGCEESVSGFGSVKDATRNIIESLSQIIDERDIQSIVDVPCGDYNWMRSLDRDVKYTGVDIVNDLIQSNQEKYASQNTSFCCLDATQDSLPSSDMLMCRDMLNHLSLGDAQLAISNFLKSKAKFYLITNFSDTDCNLPQESGFKYRPLDLRKAPFDFPEPVAEYHEYEYRESGIKSMGLWTYEQLEAAVK